MNAISPSQYLSSLPNNYGELETIYRHTLGKSYSSLAIVGPNGGEGCTSLILAMASRAAAAGESVLVLELNFASPVIGRWIHGRTAGWDLSTPISQLPIAEKVLAGVDLLPAPPAIANIHHFREPKPLRDFLRQLATRYSKILIDCSPVNRHNRHNLPAECVTAEIDATMLLTLAGSSQESQLLEAIDRLNLSGSNLIGSAINDRDFPGLACELMRETRRLDNHFPRTMYLLRQLIGRSRVINQSI